MFDSKVAIVNSQYAHTNPKDYLVQKKTLISDLVQQSQGIRI